MDRQTDRRTHKLHAKLITPLPYTGTGGNFFIPHFFYLSQNSVSSLCSLTPFCSDNCSKRSPAPISPIRAKSLDILTIPDTHSTYLGTIFIIAKNMFVGSQTENYLLFFGKQPQTQKLIFPLQIKRTIAKGSRVVESGFCQNQSSTKFQLSAFETFLQSYFAAKCEGDNDTIEADSFSLSNYTTVAGV